MKKLDLSNIMGDMFKIQAIERYINNLVIELANKGIIELEDDENELHENNMGE